MRTAIIALALLLATSPHAETVALGVGAASPSEVIVKINGKDTHVHLAGVTGGGDAARLFLQCLVAGRVVRVQGQRVTLLDGNSVANHVNEFLQSKTAADPCDLGKAAYTPAAPHATAGPATTTTPPPSAQTTTITTTATTTATAREQNLGPVPAKRTARGNRAATQRTPSSTPPPQRPTPVPKTGTDAPPPATNTVAVPTKP
jgi:hypothetical protein